MTPPATDRILDDGEALLHFRHTLEVSCLLAPIEPEELRHFWVRFGIRPLLVLQIAVHFGLLEHTEQF